MRKNIKAAILIAWSSMVLTGCASSNVKHALSAIQTSTIAYGDVTDIKAATASNTKLLCGKPDPKYDTACASLDKFVVARLAYLHSSRLVEQSFLAPVDWRLKEHSIVQVDPASNFIATRLAALDQRKGCEWTGHSLQDLTGGAGMVKNFALGMLIVPAVAVASDETIHQGGVECDGWSYKSLLTNG